MNNLWKTELYGDGVSTEIPFLVAENVATSGTD